MISGELYGSAAMKLVLSRLDDLMKERGVTPDIRENILVCAEMMYEYIPYAYSQKRDPTDAKVLGKFLLSKGKNTAKIFGHDGLKCGLSMVDFVLSANRSVSMSGVPPAAALSWALALVDLIDVGNSCEFAQQAYYEAFVRESSVSLERARRQYPRHVDPGRIQLQP